MNPTLSFLTSDSFYCFRYGSLNLRFNTQVNFKNMKVILGGFFCRSGITQQLFVISEGLLLSAYYSSPCPVPILKWMFRVRCILFNVALDIMNPEALLD